MDRCTMDDNDGDDDHDENGGPARWLLSDRR